MQRLAADDVVRQFFDELRHKRVERFGIFAVREPITLQRADDLRFVHQRLIVRSGLHRFGKIGNRDGGQKIIRRQSGRRIRFNLRLILQICAVKSVSLFRVKTVQRFLLKHSAMFTMF